MIPRVLVAPLAVARGGMMTKQTAFRRIDQFDGEHVREWSIYHKSQPYIAGTW